MLILNFIFYLSIFILCKVEINQCTQFTHDRKRVGPIDRVMAEHGCLQKFTVRENTIIRTNDSRVLGAKFLNESDIGNREDCLTLCCNTKFCNVAVFEEKTPFSCYLFDCGSTEKLLCKFTGHTQYTSAVLAINRHQFDLGMWSTQYKHEAELTHLRSPSEEAVDQGQMRETVSLSRQEAIPTDHPSPPPTTTLSPTTITASSNSSLNAQSAQNSRKCSNFQFQCHTGECIAIYNACDGIPQCKDGSDEGPELGCPSGSSDRSGIFTHRANLLDYNHFPGDVSSDYPRGEDGEGYENRGKDPSGYYNFNSGQRQLQPPSKYNIGPQSGGGGGTSSGDVGFHHEYSDYGFINQPQQVVDYPKVPQSLHHHHHHLHRQPVLAMHSNQQLQPQPPIPKIPLRDNIPQQQFRHQDLAIKDEWEQEQSDQQYLVPYEDVPQRGRQHIQQQYGENVGHESFRSQEGGMRMGLQPPKQLAGTIRQTPSGGGRQYDSLYHPNLLEERRREDASLVQRTNAVQNFKPNLSPGEERLSSTSWKQQQQQPPPPPAAGGGVDKPVHTEDQNEQKTKYAKQSSPESESESKPEPVAANASVSKNNRDDDDAAAPSATSSKPGQKSVKKASAKSESTNPLLAFSSLSRLSISVDELQREGEKQRSQTSGAILALSLGVCFTALLVVLVGCRIQKVKRRARRRRGLRSPLEHDADYLVNGMYL